MLRIAAVALAGLLLAGMQDCRTKKTEVLPAAEVLPLKTATLEELRAQLEKQQRAIQTLEATVKLEPATGSAYTGVIEEYHDVRGFLLAERRATAQGNSRQVRLLAQTPLIRKTVFDMVADENEFRIHLPPKNKFITGPTRLEKRSEKPIENMRPQHLFEALFFDAPFADTLVVVEENEFAGRRYYAVSEIVLDERGRPALSRKWWFERSRLELERAQRFDTAGRLISDVRYAAWTEAGGVAYPLQIELVRPQEDYRLKLVIEKLNLNTPLALDKFRLERPEGTELLELKPATDAAGEKRR